MMEQNIIDIIENCGLEVDDVRPIVEAVKASAVMNFVNVQIGAFESGFIDKSDLTLFDLYQFARQHVSDNYGADTPHFSDKWGVDMICHCSGGKHPKTVKIGTVKGDLKIEM